MSVSAFLSDLRARGIEITADGDQLRCSAPKGALTPELRRRIAGQKEEILSFFRKAQLVADHELPPIAPVCRDGKIPLSYGQRRMWYLYMLDPSATYNNIPTAYRLRGKLDIPVLEKSFQQIALRHESIRTSFALDNETPYQRIASTIDIRLNPVTDFTAIPSDVLEQELDKLINSEIDLPFNFTDGPLFRVKLIRLGENDHVLFFMVHHAIWDAWSFDIFMHELVVLYEHFSKGMPSPLPPLPVQYGDYTVWHRNWLQSGQEARELAYWKEQLKGELSFLNLPFDRPRPKAMSTQGDTATLALPQQLINELTVLGNKESATLFMVLLAALHVLLYRYTRQEDIIIGVPTQCRIHPDAEKLIGFFVNTLPIRLSLSGNPSFRELLDRERKCCINAFRHQNLPFDRMVEELNPERLANITPLCQVMFTLQDVRTREPMMGDIPLQQVIIRRHVAGLDLSFWVRQTADGMGGAIEYSTDLFDAETIRRFLANYTALLYAIAANPDMAIARLDVLSEEEKHLVLDDWNRTERPYASEVPAYELFERQAGQTPAAIAAVFENEGITYRELNARANQLARYLQQQGVGPEKLVGIFVERSLSMLVGLLGILKAGGAYVPLDPLFPRERLSFMLQDAGVSVLVTQQSLQAELQVSLEVNVVCIDADWGKISRESSDNLTGKAAANHLTYVLYTSGSTGLPKGVQITHQALVNFLCSMREELGITAEDILLAVTTLSFDIAGLELFLPLIAGAKVVIAPREVAADGERLAVLLEKSGATIMQATPVTWRMLLEGGWQGNKKLTILCGGEAFPADLAGPLLERSARVWNMYGPTETTIWSTVYRMCLKDGPVLIGRPIANTRIYILDDTMMPVPIGATGELYVGGAGVAWGYLNRPELTEERFISCSFTNNTQERLYRTGDIARYRNDGTIECLGRVDFQVKIRGYRIELGEIEAVFQKHPAVQSVIVDARDTGNGDKRLVAYFIGVSSEEAPSVQTLREFARTMLPEYMVPSAYVLLDHFPLTPNGKIDRKALPEPGAGAHADVSDAYAPPRNEIEMTIVSLWQSLLQVKQVGIHDSFFDLGGHSLLALQLFARLEKIFHKQLPLATLFEAPTIEQLGAIVASQNWKPSWDSLVPIQPGGSKPPFFCMHGAGGNVLLYRDLARHLGPDQPFYGLQAKGLDGTTPFQTTIEDMARDYVKEIRELQPEGPYYLGGYCLGGAIAYEIACMLSSQGQRVGVVAMFDTQRQWRTDLQLRILWYQKYQKIAFHARNFLKADPKGKRDFLFEKMAESVRRLNRRCAILTSIIAYRLKLRVLQPLVLMETINDNAVIQYKPAPYSGRVALFKPCRAYAGYDDDPLYGWGNGLTAGVDVYELSSYPAGMLVEPFVVELAEKLKSCLQEAQYKRDDSITSAVYG